ncbi:MAG: hypothetical protein GF330_12750 [Candidatus Eisenbacteria bacterium]|nr:hypothetical protein [Candidatus Eisenbacteria bacterium]
MPGSVIQINRAPVLTLWASVVAERLGFEPDEALSLGKAMAGLTAQSKGRRLGVYKRRYTKDGHPAPKHGLGEEFWVELCGRTVPAQETDDGVRAVVKDQPVDPEKTTAYLKQKFGDDLARVRKAMEKLACAHDLDELSEIAFALYEKFRPAIPPGRRGWGAKGDLDLAQIRRMAR